MFDRLKTKWGIETNTRFLKILLVFAITGSSSVWIRKPVWAIVGVNESWMWYEKTILWLLTILPAYQLLLVLWGSLFGEYPFFKGFIKKMWLRR